MRAVLGIDAAWTEPEPSGVALLVGDGDRWTCRAVAPSYEQFVQLAQGVPVDWTSRVSAAGAVPTEALINAAARLAGCEVRLVAVDMPISTVPIAGRRAADDAVSVEYGGRHCSAHSPSADRPGAIGSQLTSGLEGLGFRLATKGLPRPEGPTLIEVYPHTALLSLMNVGRRVAYKVSKSSKLWPGLQAHQRVSKLLEIFNIIRKHLAARLGELPFNIPANATSLSDLKRYEDALDAVVSAWMGTLYLQGRATPLGNDEAAVWVPSDTIRTAPAVCRLCAAIESRTLIASNPAAVAFFDGFPVSPGHALIVSRRHVGSMFVLTEPEQVAIWRLLREVKAAIEVQHAPTAYNIGVNIGPDAGQTVDHVHVHVIPRYKGDVDDPRGGVRWVLPAKADYWSGRQ